MVTLEGAGVVDLYVAGELVTELTVEDVAWDTGPKELGVWLGFVDVLSMLAPVWHIALEKRGVFTQNYQDRVEDS